MDPHPGRGQHPRSPARADPAAGHRQGTAGGRREGARPLAAPLSGGAGVAPGRVLGAGPAAVRHGHRSPMTGDGPAGAGDSPPAGGDSPAGAGDSPPTSGPVLKVVAGDPSAEELAALAVALSAVLAARDGPAVRPGRAASGWAGRSRMMGAPPRPGPDAWRRSTWPR